MTLNYAIQQLLNLIEQEAESAFAEYRNGRWHWNERIWKKHDPKLYKRWKDVQTALAKSQ